MALFVEFLGAKAVKGFQVIGNPSAHISNYSTARYELPKVYDRFNEICKTSLRDGPFLSRLKMFLELNEWNLKCILEFNNSFCGMCIIQFTKSIEVQ